MDRQALRLANLLAGNGAHAACIEITLGGFAAQALCDAHFALTGAKTEATCEGRPLANWETHFVRKGEIIQTGPSVSGMRTYLAVQGGIDVPEVMGSRSTFLRGNLGGFKGRSLRREDLLILGEPAKTGASFPVFKLPPELIPIYSPKARLRVLPGPQIERLTPRGVQTFFSSEYVVTNRSDRMGAMLLGPAVELSRGGDIISDGAFPGAVQIPGNGLPVILGSDCQTTGGYVKCATIIDVDLPVAAQLGPGNTVGFVGVTLDEARLAYLKNEYLFARLNEKSAKTGGAT
jgi:biotin-dependent carboxylase-like uncharacterized protein